MDNKFSLVLCKKSELISYRRVFSESEIAPILNLHIPNEYYDYSLYEISQISDPKYELDIPTYVKQNCSPAWLDIRVGGLDITPGQHDYVVKYYDVDTNSYHSAYFGYIIQQSPIEKPYLYIDR